MTKRKKVFYPTRQNNKRQSAAGPDQVIERPNLATINLEAGAGRPGFKVGDKVRIEGSGMYAGENAVIERLSAGVIPSALVRTESGATRQVRTIDLARPSAKPEVAEPEPSEA